MQSQLDRIEQMLSDLLARMSGTGPDHAVTMTVDKEIALAKLQGRSVKDAIAARVEAAKKDKKRRK